MRHPKAFALLRPIGMSPDAPSLVGLAIALWGSVFVLFTMRSFTLGLPYIGEQAALRFIMMGIGAGLCGLLYFAANAVRALSRLVQAAFLAAAVLASGAFYSGANYTLLYVIAADWPDTFPAFAVIVGYFTSTVWIFALWLSLLFLLRGHAPSLGASSDASAAAADGVLWLSQNGGRVRIGLQDVDWVQSEGDYVRLYVHGRSYLHRMTLEGAEKLLRSFGFVRVHRRFLIPLREVERVARGPTGRRMAVLRGGVTVPIGRAYMTRVRQLISTRF